MTKVIISGKRAKTKTFEDIAPGDYFFIREDDAGLVGTAQILLLRISVLPDGIGAVDVETGELHSIDYWAPVTEVASVQILFEETR